MGATVTQLWQHSEPSEFNQQYELQLLTICGISVMGRWCGEFGEYYVGWSLPLTTTLSQLVPVYQLPHQPQQSNHIN